MSWRARRNDQATSPAAASTAPREPRTPIPGRGRRRRRAVARVPPTARRTGQVPSWRRGSRTPRSVRRSPVAESPGRVLPRPSPRSCRPRAPASPPRSEGTEPARPLASGVSITTRLVGEALWHARSQGRSHRRETGRSNSARQLEADPDGPGTGVAPDHRTRGLSSRLVGRVGAVEHVAFSSPMSLAAPLATARRSSGPASGPCREVLRERWPVRCLDSTSTIPAHLERTGLIDKREPTRWAAPPMRPPVLEEVEAIEDAVGRRQRHEILEARGDLVDRLALLRHVHGREHRGGLLRR